MRYFVTGASGYIGQRLTEKLLVNGHEVVAFCRRPDSLHLQSERLMVAQGDVCDVTTLDSMQGADLVFHLASLTSQWSSDRELFYHVNIEGTQNVLSKALEFGVQKVVYTSTAGVFGPGKKDELLDEQSARKTDGKTDYEISKVKAEELAVKMADESGLHVCIVNPTRVFGPGVMSESNAMTRIIERFHHGRIQFVPGFSSFHGNYVFIDDVIDGHIRAMELGRSGRNYILGGTNMTVGQLFEQLHELTGQKSVMVTVPKPILTAYSHLQLLRARLFGARPVITPAFVEKYASHNAFDCSRACDELGYSPTNWSDAVTQTTVWLSSRDGN